MYPDITTPHEAFERFLSWERVSRDVLDVKRIYIDVAGDLIAGIVLSEIVYWHLPSKAGGSKLRVVHDDKEWLAVRRYEWWSRVRITPDQADRALSILVERELIEKKVFKFKGEPTTHIRILKEAFCTAVAEATANPPENPYAPDAGKSSENPFSAVGENEIRESAKTKSVKEQNPLTETTTQTPTEIKTAAATGSPSASDESHELSIEELEKLAKKMECSRKRLCSEYQATFGTSPTEHMEIELQNAGQKYGSAYVIAALRETANANVLRWSYCKKILKRWDVEGTPTPFRTYGRAESSNHAAVNTNQYDMQHWQAS